MQVDLKAVSFGYQKNSLVLEDIDLYVPTSGNISIVGSSGSGKSTLLRLLSGLLPNDKNQFFKGSIKVADIDLCHDVQRWEEIRANGDIGFMFQEPSLLPFLNVQANINFPLKIVKQDQKIAKVVSDYLNLTGLSQHTGKYPFELSGGMKTRVALARTFITNPKLLLLDEPFSALDIVWKSKLYEELKRLKKQMGTTILLVTHDIFEAIYFSDTIIVMGNDRRIIGEIKINNWQDPESYNDVVTQHFQDFVRIKNCIESQQYHEN